MAAIHEISSLCAILEFVSKAPAALGLIAVTPLMVLVEYAGHRVLAISLLPIGRETIVYGSADGGKTVHDDDAVVHDFMEAMSNEFGLLPHDILPTSTGGPAVRLASLRCTRCR